MQVMIYVRVSTVEQAREGYSIQEQISRLKKYSEAMGWTVYDIYTDAGFSGAKLERPALSRLIRDVQNKRAEKVLVYKLDRLSRSQLDTLFLIEKVFLANQVDFVSMSENFDTSTPFGRAMIGILAVFAQLEREQIRERMQMGKEARAKEGKFGGSWNVPIGYDYEEGQLVVNEYEKMQVLEVFEMFFEGVPIKRMIQILEDKGYRHKFGLWNDRTIRNVLRSKTYLGFIKHRGEWLQGAHKPIVSQEAHEKAVRMLDERKKAYEQNHRPGKVQSYLGGLLVCKQCGAKYAKITSSRDKNGAQRCYYYCNSRSKTMQKLVKNPDCKNKNWRMEELDEIIFSQIRLLAVDPEAFSDAKPEEQKNRPEILRAEIEKIDSQINRIMDLYVLGNLPVNVLQSKVEDLTEQKEKLEDETDQIQQAETKLTKQAAADYLKTFGDVLDNGSFQQIREVLTSLIDRIELDGETVEIHWNFS